MSSLLPVWLILIPLIVHTYPLSKLIVMAGRLLTTNIISPSFSFGSIVKPPFFIIKLSEYSPGASFILLLGSAASIAS
jgi:hypothetical protein